MTIIVFIMALLELLAPNTSEPVPTAVVSTATLEPEPCWEFNGDLTEEDPHGFPQGPPPGWHLKMPNGFVASFADARNNPNAPGPTC